MVLRRQARIVALVAALVVVPTSPGKAAPTAYAGIMAASGTASPGLFVLTPLPQSIALTAAANQVFLGTPFAAQLASASCSFSGTSSGTFGNEVLALGSGKMTGGCSGPGPNGGSFSASCALDYIREGLQYIDGHCAVTIDGTSSTVKFDGVFMFIPTSQLPTTSFQLFGKFTATSL